MAAVALMAQSVVPITTDSPKVAKSHNLVPFSGNVVLSTPMSSANPVPEKRMFSVPAIYVLGPLHLCGAERLQEHRRVQRELAAAKAELQTRTVV